MPPLATQLAAKLGASVTGLDASEAELSIARERVPDGDFRQGEMEELPYADASFDVVHGASVASQAQLVEAHAYLEDALVEVAGGTRVGGPKLLQ